MTKGEGIALGVRLRGGATEPLALPLEPRACDRYRTPAGVVAEIDALLEDYTAAAVARILNDRGRRPLKGGAFSAERVQRVRRTYGLKPRCERLRARGLLDLKEMAERLGVTTGTVKKWRDREPPAGARRDLQIPGGLLQPAPAPFGARLSLPGRVRAGLERGAATVALTITFRRALLAARFRRRRALLRHLFAGRLPGSRWSPSSPSSPRFHCLPLDFSSPLRHHGAALSRATAPTAHLSVHETVATSHDLARCPRVDRHLQCLQHECGRLARAHGPAHHLAAEHVQHRG